MCLTNEDVGSKIVAKIKIYILIRAELLFNLCYEIPCSKQPPELEEAIVLQNTQSSVLIIYHMSISFKDITYANLCTPLYRGSPTYTKITTMVSTNTVFGLCTCKWGILALVGDHITVPLTRVSCNTVFSKSQNPRKAGTLCRQNIASD